MGKKKSPFRCLVESEEGIKNFCSKYGIPSTVGMRYAAQGEWVDARQPNIFRVLGSINALNERMDLKLTHHDVNWVYNLHHLKGQGYYLRSRYPEVRLIQYLPTSNKIGRAHV